MRIAALAGHRVDRFDVVGAVAIEEVVDHGDDVVLAHARPQLLVHEVIGAVDHAGGVVQERDFVLRLDLACFQHDLLTVGDLEAGFLQFEHHRRFDDVDADRHVGDAVFAQDRGEFLGVLLHQAEGGRHGAAQADQAGLAVLRVEPRRIELVMHGGGAEVPQDRFAGAGQQRPARQLVALPLADLGRGEIADVVDVEHQQRAKFGLLQCLLGAAEAVAVQAAEIDALFRRDARAALYIDRVITPVLRPSESQLRDVFHTAAHPFRSLSLDDAREGLSRWLAAERVRGAETAFSQTARARVVLTYAAREP